MTSQPRAAPASQPAKAARDGVGVCGRGEQILVVGLGRAEEGHAARGADRRATTSGKRPTSAPSSSRAVSTRRRPRRRCDHQARAHSHDLERRGRRRASWSARQSAARRSSAASSSRAVDDHAAFRRTRATSASGGRRATSWRRAPRGARRPPARRSARGRRGAAVVHAAAQRGVDDEGAELRGEFVVVLGEQPVAAVLDELGGAAGAHGHDRQAGGARLERDDAERLVQRRQREEIGGGEVRRDGVARHGAEELDVLARPRRAASARTAPASGPSPARTRRTSLVEAVRVRAAQDVGQRADERERPLARVQAQDRRDGDCSARGRARRRGEAGGVDAVGQERDVAAPATGARARRRRGCRRRTGASATPPTRGRRRAAAAPRRDRRASGSSAATACRRGAPARWRRARAASRGCARAPRRRPLARRARAGRRARGGCRRRASRARAAPRGDARRAQPGPAWR